jgi:hypothetical protein
VSRAQAAGPHDEMTADPQRRSSAPPVGRAHVNKTPSIPSLSRSLRPAQPAAHRSVACGEASPPDCSKHQAYRLSTGSDAGGGPQPRRPRRDTLAVRAWPHNFAQTDDPSHHPSNPHADCPATAGTLPKLPMVGPACALGAARSSVARGARLTAAGCFHTLVSAIRRAAGLRGGAVRVARRTIVRNRVGGRGPGRSGRCSGC